MRRGGGWGVARRRGRDWQDWGDVLVLSMVEGKAKARMTSKFHDGLSLVRLRSMS